MYTAHSSKSAPAAWSHGEPERLLLEPERLLAMFGMLELLAVAAMVGVLEALAMVGMREELPEVGMLAELATARVITVVIIIVIGEV